MPASKGNNKRKQKTGIDVTGSISVLQTDCAGSNPVYPSKHGAVNKTFPRWR